MGRFIGGRGAVVGVVLLVLLGGLGGCTAPGRSQAAPATTAQPDRVAVWRELIRCVRANGMPNLPDPQFDQSGEPQFPGGTPDPPERARRACEPILDRLPPEASSAPRNNEYQPTAADVPALLRFARCMREHGLAEFPDPAADGRFKFSGTAFGAAMEREGKSPRLLAAMRACKQLNPDPRGGIHGK